MPKKKILLKVSGTLFSLDQDRRRAIFLDAIGQLQQHFLFGVVVGGGNLFRGHVQGPRLGISPASAHAAGMMATVMNGIILHNLLIKQGYDAIHASAFCLPTIAQACSVATITHALKSEQIIVFSGGTGNPFFSTDTNAVLRALEGNFDEMWKATDVDGVYERDPQQDPTARIIKKISYDDSITRRLGILDMTAYTLAQNNTLVIRVFHSDLLLHAAHDRTIGTIIE
jgi:uridylate kinase